MKQPRWILNTNIRIYVTKEGKHFYRRDLTMRLADLVIKFVKYNEKPYVLIEYQEMFLDKSSKETIEYKRTDWIKILVRLQQESVDVNETVCYKAVGIERKNLLVEIYMNVHFGLISAPLVRRA
jgi:hypothetical protein